jgi:reactive intermediate/imine deaminase
MQFISAPGLPPPAGHYTQAVRAGGFVFLSGMLPGPPAPGEIDGFERQTQATLAHCRRVLDAAGCELTDVVQCTAYIVGVAHWPTFNTIYARLFGDHRPARAVVPVPELHHGYLVELQMVAYRE